MTSPTYLFLGARVNRWELCHYLVKNSLYSEEELQDFDVQSRDFETNLLMKLNNIDVKTGITYTKESLLKLLNEFSHLIETVKLIEKIVEYKIDILDLDLSKCNKYMDKYCNIYGDVDTAKNFFDLVKKYKKFKDDGSMDEFEGYIIYMNILPEEIEERFFQKESKIKMEIIQLTHDVDKNGDYVIGYRFENGSKYDDSVGIQINTILDKIKEIEDRKLDKIFNVLNKKISIHKVRDYCNCCY